MITVIDYGMGNVGSILNMLKKIRVAAAVSSGIEDIRAADKLILPGVGAFDNGIRSLNERGLIELLQERIIEDRIPILGVCLGMQLLTESSEEGNLKGLGFIRARTVRFKFEKNNLKVPNMGWNFVEIKKESKLFKKMDRNSRFYFVHSYYVVCENKEDILATTVYGFPFVSAFEVENIFGVQFHPEKSHKFGMQLLKNFAEL